MAWAEKLPSGRYRGVYRDATGRRLSAGTFTHKPKAERAAAAREERARKSMRSDPEGFRRPWGEWAEEWWPTRGVEVSTERADRIRRAKHLDEVWTHVPIGAITRQDVKAWIASMSRAGVSAATRQRAVHLLSASLTAAVDAEIIEANPAARLKLEKGAQAQERFLTHEEYDAVRAEMPTEFDQLVCDLLVNTGLRWSELTGLHRGRVDLERGLLRVVETYEETDMTMKPYPKGRRLRDVPLIPALRESLSKHYADVPAVGTCGTDHRSGSCRSPLVLTTTGGRPLRNSNWTPIWRDAVKRAGIGHARPYDLRHTYASWLLQSREVELAELSMLMGHQNIQTTMIYAHLAATPNDRVIAALAAPQKPHADAGSGTVQA